MDKLVMLVKLLLVAVYIISECECYLYTLDQVMCPRYGKTVVTATVVNVETSDANGNIMYRMELSETHKEGRNALNTLKDHTFTMRFPPIEMSCGYTFPITDNIEYVITGDVGVDGILSSNVCQYARPAKEVYEDSENMALLYFGRNPSCSGRGDS